MSPPGIFGRGKQEEESSEQKKKKKRIKTGAGALLVPHLERPGSQILPTPKHTLFHRCSKERSCMRVCVPRSRVSAAFSLQNVTQPPAALGERAAQGANSQHGSDAGVRPWLFAFPHPCASAAPRLCVSLLPETLLQEPSSTSSLAGNQLPAGFF